MDKIAVKSELMLDTECEYECALLRAHTILFLFLYVLLRDMRASTGPYMWASKMLNTEFGCRLRLA